MESGAKRIPDMARPGEGLPRVPILSVYCGIAGASGWNPARMLLDTGLRPGVDETDLMMPVERVGAFYRHRQKLQMAVKEVHAERSPG